MDARQTRPSTSSSWPWRSALRRDRAEIGRICGFTDRLVYTRPVSIYRSLGKCCKKRRVVKKWRNCRGASFRCDAQGLTEEEDQSNHITFG
jgi:hypothetical protein